MTTEEATPTIWVRDTVSVTTRCLQIFSVPTHPRGELNDGVCRRIEPVQFLGKLTKS